MRFIYDADKERLEAAFKALGKPCIPGRGATPEDQAVARGLIWQVLQNMKEIETSGHKQRERN